MGKMMPISHLYGEKNAQISESHALEPKDITNNLGLRQYYCQNNNLKLGGEHNGTMACVYFDFSGLE